MASMFRAYSSFLLRRPVLGSCLTSAVLFGAGDVAAQQAVERRGTDHDLARTARLAFYGGAVFGPPVATWFGVLGRLQFTSPAKAVVYRTFLDQTLAAPVMVGVFFSVMPLLEGRGPAESQRRLSANYANTLIANWGVFVPAQLVNFSVVPPQLRFVFIGVVSLFWNTYLSAVNAAQAQSKKPLTLGEL
ncbi:hypothetical protein K488DRAFT_77606 [Vararia minispora EC-137]|uniref:Uncharacterized protein n=1 Tax=Vararia minispora EC-137 TaxID=1314806 RepID=A0ACB8QQD0_9AGAM|nr:hypothetical protein K488DRAFT_77606 [Vararia minispora EC-137]